MKPPRKAGNDADTPEAPPAGNRATAEVDPAIRRHLVFGWGSMLVFLTLGILLEALHGLKIGAYLNPTASARRLMWTLAHAHGTLLGLVHVAFAATLFILRPGDGRWIAWVSGCLRAATLLLPGGFFLAGLVTYGGDPGLGVFLVPIGALIFLLGVGSLWLGVRKK